MTDKGKNRSIVGRINSMIWKMMLLLGTPVIVALILMFFISRQYSGAIDRMGTIAALKPVIGEQIPETVWSVVSGRETLDGSGLDEMLSDVNSTISHVSARTGERNRLELVVAGRTMGTLSQYVQRIRENLGNGTPVVENEEILAEIRSVADLVVSMLNDYITEEIGEAERMSKSAGRLMLAAAAIELALLALAIFMTRRFASRTSRFVREPIEKLESVTAQLAKGDMSARLPMTQVAELWNLTGQVNQMADNLDDMMQQRKKDERNLRKAELRTLQAQINPHFLYNTLDAIVWKAEAGDEEGVIHLTRALSDFFRISLSSGADWISISQEKKHIAGYLSIQRTRYRDILNYEIDIPDEIGRYYILKLLLQPLVENALYHGIKYRRGGGTILVTGRKQGEDLVFTVKDTGKGMDEATLETLRQHMAQEQPVHSSGTNGFGLVNVNLRIRLYYNVPEGLSIESGPEGTTVSFRVPCRTAEDLEHDESISG